MNTKQFFLELYQTLDFKNFLKRCFLGLGIILLISFVINLAGLLYEVKTTRAFIFSYDNDAGRGVQTAVLTRWYNSNHFAPYGNLYFRCAHTLAKLTPVSARSDLTKSDQTEIQHHFALLAVSLLSLAAFCITLAYYISGRWDYSVWMANILLHLAIYNTTWVKYIFIVHPDHLLMLMTLFAAYFTLKYTKDQNQRDFITAALFWGIATAVKKSTILFIPSFLFLFLSEGFNRQSFLKGLKFIGYMLLAYMVIGFPQNFSIYKHVRFMITESANSRPPNMDSIKEYLELFYLQSKYLILALVPMQLFFGRPSKLMNKKFAGFAFIAILVVFSSNMISTKEHHVMPQIAVLLVSILFSLKLVPTLSFKYKTQLLGIMCIGSLLFLGHADEPFKDQRDNMQACAPEAHTALEIVKKIQKTDKVLLLRDPYFPFDSSMPELNSQHWGLSLELIDELNAAIIGSKIGFMKSYSTRVYKSHVDPDILKWKQKVEFNKMAPGAETFTTPQGKIFRKIYQDQCGYVIWKKQ